LNEFDKMQQRKRRGTAMKRDDGHGMVQKGKAQARPQQAASAKSIKGQKGSLTTGSGAPAAGARTLEDAIGAQVRDFRKAAGLTVSELGSAAKISTAMVSKIENGQISASLSVLRNLAAALNLPLTMLLASFEGRRGCSFVKKGKGLIIRRRGTKAGHEYQQLGQSISGTIAFEPYLITLSKEAEPYTQFRHEGLELIYMLTGEITYLHGENRYQMEPGDCILFDSAEFHGPETLVKLPATYLSIIVYSRR
jgi:transcriptional regulator with XRE-family HTH domain